MIKNINIENYKGIKKANIKDFGSVNLIVGKNNSSKTNLLEALYLISESQNFQIEKHSKEEISLHIYYRIIDLKILSLTEDFEDFRMHDEIKISEIIQNIIYNHKLENELKIETTKTTINIIINDILNKDKDTDTDRDMYMYIRRRRGRRERTNINNFIPTGIDNNNNLSDICSNIKINKNERPLLKTLGKIDNRIQDIQPLLNTIYLKYQGLDKLADVKTMGDGIIRVLEVITKMYYSRQSKMFFIDEIENGLYYETQKTVLRSILQSSKDFGIQVFMTTHSIEIIKHLRDILEEEEFKDMQQKTKVISLLRKEDDELKGYSYDYNSFDNAIETQSEIR